MSAEPGRQDSSSSNVLRLGFVSLLNDISSDALTRVLPLYISGVLHAPLAAVGAIEGMADATSTLLKPYFGRLSDRLKTRKSFVVWGYAFSVLTRPLLAFVGSWPQAGFLRFADRVGKAVRTAPRDAMIAESSGHKSRHGRSFGINRAMDTLGALLSVGLLAYWLRAHGEIRIAPDSWRFLCLGLSIPGALAVVLVAVGIRETRAIRPADDSVPIDPRLPPVLKRYLICAGLFALANSSDAFVLLRLKELGYSLPETLAFVAFHQLVAAVSSIPAASLSDRLGRKPLLCLGWMIYAACYCALGSRWLVDRTGLVVLTMAIYGLFYGFTEGVEKAFVADLAPASARGKAFGIFGLVVGAMALPASTAFGMAWERWGSATPFYGSAILAGIALFSLLLFVKEEH